MVKAISTGRGAFIEGTIAVDLREKLPRLQFAVPIGVSGISLNIDRNHEFLRGKPESVLVPDSKDDGPVT